MLKRKKNQKAESIYFQPIITHKKYMNLINFKSDF